MSNYILRSAMNHEDASEERSEAIQDLTDQYMNDLGEFSVCDIADALVELPPHICANIQEAMATNQYEDLGKLIALNVWEYYRKRAERFAKDSFENR